MASLKDGWDGKALFAAAFRATLPRRVRAAVASDEPDEPITVSKNDPLAPPRRRRVSRFTKEYTVVSRFHGARPGSKRAKQLEIVLAHGDTASAKRAGAEGVDISYAESIGLIKFI